MRIKQKHQVTKGVNYFQPEFKPFIDQKTDEIEIPNNFDENRRIGENDLYICELIRSDSIDEFQKYLSQNNLPIETKIEPSVFETNSFLIKNQPSLIEYAAFYGSIQVFKFLLLNDASLNPMLWMYAIHSMNSDMIHLLELYHIEPEDKSYQEILKESIKCHHNNIANYIRENYIHEEIESKFGQNEYSYGFHYHNFDFFTEDFYYHFNFYYACFYDYLQIVEIILKEKAVDLNEQIISLFIFS